MSKTRTIKVDYLARVEGEGALLIKIKGGAVTDVKLKIFEPPRFFEAFMRGRDFREAPDITARICGICPVAYQMSSVHAMENALGVTVDGQLRALRRLLYCGEWIESHALHVYMLHAPDFLGYPDVIQMAKDHPEIVQKALVLKRAGNDIVALLGGREIHPVNVRVGGFYSVPSRRDLDALRARLEKALELALETVRWTAGLPIPQHDEDYEFVALRTENEYPFCEGRLVSNKGLDIAVRDYEEHFAEAHVPYSNALHSVLTERGAYLVGPLSRFNLNFDRLTPLAKNAAIEAGLKPPVRNQFRSIVVRAVETVFATEEALRIIGDYTPPERPSVELKPRAAIGYGCTEAPRGILYHRYRIDDRGVIADAKIVPPTSQNQKSMEHDLLRVVEENLQLDDEALTARCETALRNYDPCISCATHFLKLTVDRQ
jgi:sulfhydrogenase subunit alpha